MALAKGEYGCVYSEILACEDRGDTGDFARRPVLTSWSDEDEAKIITYKGMNN
jgi:hypothetical protein